MVCIQIGGVGNEPVQSDRALEITEVYPRLFGGDVQAVAGDRDMIRNVDLDRVISVVLARSPMNAAPTPTLEPLDTLTAPARTASLVLS